MSETAPNPAPAGKPPAAGAIPNATDRAAFDAHVFAGLLTAGWQMEQIERIALLHVVSSVRPRCAIEIGTADGGSLSAIARHSERVFTLDIRADRAAVLGKHFTNVEFVAGPSAETLPPLLERLSHEHTPLDFVLIDGDHRESAVRRDIEDLLDGVHPWDRSLMVLMHDSFNPDCRRGIAAADWNRNPHVRRVQLDYVPGVFPGDEDGGEVARQMWGGFALATLRPGARGDRPVNMQARRQLLFETVRAHSVHATDPARQG